MNLDQFIQQLEAVNEGTGLETVTVMDRSGQVLHIGNIEWYEGAFGGEPGISIIGGDVVEDDE